MPGTAEDGAHQVEERVPEITQFIIDVVPEQVEEEHVASDV